MASDSPSSFPSPLLIRLGLCGNDVPSYAQHVSDLIVRNIPRCGETVLQYLRRLMAPIDPLEEVKYLSRAYPDNAAMEQLQKEQWDKQDAREYLVLHGRKCDLILQLSADATPIVFESKARVEASKTEIERFAFGEKEVKNISTTNIQPTALVVGVGSGSDDDAIALYPVALLESKAALASVTQEEKAEWIGRRMLILPLGVPIDLDDALAATTISLDEEESVDVGPAAGSSSESREKEASDSSQPEADPIDVVAVFSLDGTEGSEIVDGPIHLLGQHNIGEHRYLVYGGTFGSVMQAEEVLDMVIVNGHGWSKGLAASRVGYRFADVTNNDIEDVLNPAL